MTRHHSCRVSPFGHPRINARLAAPRGITQPPTSFIGSQCQGIHHAPLNTYNTKPKNEFNSHTPQRGHASIRKICITTKQQPTPTPPPPTKGRRDTSAQAVIQMLATTIHKSNTTPHHQSRAATRTPEENSESRHPSPFRERPAGLLPQDPTVCLAISSPTRFPVGPNMFVVHPNPTHYRREPISRIAANTEPPHNVGGPQSRGAP